MKGSDSMQSSCVHMCKKNDLNLQPVISIILLWSTSQPLFESDCSFCLKSKPSHLNADTWLEF